MTKRAALTGVLLLLIALLLSACATSGEEATTSGSTPTVPGEKISDEGRVTPGAAGSSARVNW